MLKANELRIGNLIEVKKGFGLEPVFVTVETLQRIEAGQRSDYQPIPLTENWMTKFGGEFTFNQSNEPIVSFDMGGRLKLTFVNGNADCCDLTQDGKILSLPHGRIRYVHRFQNLCFDLSGKELQLNPQPEPTQ